MQEATLDYAALVEQDQRLLHPMQNVATHTDPIIIEHGDGVWLHTVDGRKILDGLAGLWNVNIGYGNTELGTVAKTQMDKLAYASNYAGMSNLPAIELANKLAGFAYPDLNTTYFASGGGRSQRERLQNRALLLETPGQAR